VAAVDSARIFYCYQLVLITYHDGVWKFHSRLRRVVVEIPNRVLKIKVWRESLFVLQVGSFLRERTACGPYGATRGCCHMLLESLRCFLSELYTG
jgi:hypothetical protein